MNNNKIGKFILSLRKEKGLTQQEVADKLFVTDKAVSKWERGLSLPNITILERLAELLGASVSEILCGERGTREKINVEEEIEKAINNIKKEQRQQKKKVIKYFCLSFLFLIIIGLIIISFIFNYKKYHPNVIMIGDNNYKIDNYSLEKNGLSELQNIVEKSENATKNYNVSYLEIKLNKRGNLEKFTLSVNFFNESEKCVGHGSYTYQNNILKYSYSKKTYNNSLLVETYSKSSNINYISNQIKKIPITRQIKVSELKNYVISYRPYTYLEFNTPIFDAQDSKKINVLTKTEYNNNAGGKSGKGRYFVIRLNEGSLTSGQQYLYVFDSIEEDTPSNPNYMMETDYYINNGKLRFTRDYGKSWIDTDITKEELKDTLNGDISLPTNSWYLSKNETLPIAYFYGKGAKLKISNDNGNTWNEYNFLESGDNFGKSITQKVVGFTSSNFGYVALGTDWTMGSGEVKQLYLTYDGGKTWNKSNLPLNGTSHILYDLCMYDENVGVLILRDTLHSNFPLIYSTTSGGKSWNEVRYKDSNLPDEIDYLSEVDSIIKRGSEYFIKLGQGDEGTLKATFRAIDMIGFTFNKVTYENIHTVG